METWQKPSFRSLLQETSIFVTCVELVNSRGVIAEREGTRMLKLARELSQNPQIHALCITSNAGGNAMLSGDTLGTDLISRGQEVVIHLSCATSLSDKNSFSADTFVVTNIIFSAGKFLQRNTTKFDFSVIGDFFSQSCATTSTENDRIFGHFTE